MKSAVVRRFFGLFVILSLVVVARMACPTIIEDFNDALDPGAWTFSGSANHDVGAGHLELTPAANDQSGAAWLNETVDCTSFRATFKVYIGDGNGADGMVFGWVRAQGIGGGGGGLGWYGGGLSGYGIVFDTYPNPDVNMVSFENPEVHTGGDTGGYANYIPPIDLEHTGWFDVEVEMDNGHLQVWMANEPGGLSRTLAIDYTLADYTGFDAYFGSTGATGGLNNNHWIDDLAIIIGAYAGTDQLVESGDTVTLDGSSSHNVTSYHWEQIIVGTEPSVTLDDPNPADGITTFTAPTVTEGVILTFRLTTDGPGGPSSDEMQVTVRAGNAPTSAPSNIRVYPSDLGVSVVWDPMIDADDYGFGIRLAPGMYFWFWPAVPSYELTNLTEGDVTTFAVKARNSYGEGPQSEDVTVVAMRNYALLATDYVYVISHYNIGDMNNGVVNDTNDSWDGNPKDEDYWGYLSPADMYVDHITYYTGNMFFDGGWFLNLTVQYTQDGGTTWKDVPTRIEPDYDYTDEPEGKVPYTRYDMYIPTLYGTGVRIYGTPGGIATFTSIAELEVYGDNATARPLVVQGIDGEVPERGTGTIDASFSFSTRGDITSMIYSQISGPSVSITGDPVDPLKATFEAPGVDADTELVFGIEGSDGTDTLTDEVTMVVKNLVTTAVAGPNQSVVEGIGVTLDGSASLTTTGTLTYLWTQTAGTPVTINGADAAVATFDAPVLWGHMEELTFQLEVNDGAGGVSTDEVVIKVANSLTVSVFDVYPIDDAPGWQFLGSANYDEGAGILEITPAMNNQTGAAFLRETIDSTKFQANFKVYIGDGSGADGMVFGWVTSPGIGSGGGGMGWYGGGFTGYGLVFDTWPNPDVNMVSFENPEVHTGGDTGGYVNYTPPIDLEHTGWFDMEVQMDNGHLQVWMANEAQGFERTLAIDYIIDGYTGFDAYFCFTGATGGANNNHWVDALPVVLSDAYAVRELPASYQPGGTVDVGLSMRVNPDAIPAAVTISEPIPGGLTVVDAGGGTVVGGSINWTFSGNEVGTQVVTYTLGVPAGTTGPLDFTGTILFAGTTEDIQGENVVYETPSAPANVYAQLLIAAHLNWTASPEEGVTGYKVYRSENGGAWEEIGVASGTSYVDKWLDEGSTYNYQVSAVNAAGVEGPLSDPTGEQMISMLIREAEDFNYGGGLYPGYQDCPAAIEATAEDDLTGTDFWHPNTGGPNVYRPANVTPDGIGIETVAEADNPIFDHTNIGWVDVGSWYRYTFDVPAPGPGDPPDGWVKLTFRVACPDGGTLAAYWDEVLVGSVSYDTDNWHIFTEAVMEDQVQTTPGVHTLRVQSTAGGVNLDKIGVGFNWSPPTREDLFADDFEEHTDLYNLINLDWIVVNGSGDPLGGYRLWNTTGDMLGNEPPNIAGMTDNYAISDSDLAPTAALNEELITPAIDATEHIRLRLNFSKNYRPYFDDTEHLQIAEVDIRSSDDGTTWGDWVNLLHWDRTTVADIDSTPEEVDLSAYDGKHIQIRWHFYDATFDYWFAIDDVRVSGDKVEKPPPKGKILSVGYVAGVADLTWEAFGDGNYTVQYTNDLTGGSWDPIPDETWPITATAWSGDISAIFGEGVYLRVSSD